MERPVFNSHRQFKIEAPQPADLIFTDDNIKTYLFKDAASKCRFNKEKTSVILKDLFQEPKSRSAQTLSFFFPDFSFKKIKDVRILFDSFGPLNNLFRAFYIASDKHRPGTISVDCSPETLEQLPEVLGHELAHHLNAKKNLSPWIDEMIAQLVEIRIRNSFPTLSYQVLSGKAQIPSFFARETTFQSTDQYSVNSLFGFWFAQNFGGWKTLSSIPADTRSLLAFADSARFNDQDPQKRKLLTPALLIRHFALALNINQPAEDEPTLYQVPGWQGFSPHSETQQQGLYTIEPGGFLRISTQWLPYLTGISRHSSLEVYRISKAQGQVYVNSIHTSVKAESFSEDYLLLINTSTSLDATFQLP